MGRDSNFPFYGVLESVLHSIDRNQQEKLSEKKKKQIRKLDFKQTNQIR